MDEPSWLDKTRGYIDLGMLDEAKLELEKLSPDKSGSPEAQEIRIVIALDEEKLDEALSLSEVLCDLFPDKHAGFIQGAFCLHAMDRTEEAIEHLQSGPQSLRDEPVYFYNLACYELALGRKQAALTWLKKSIEMDATFHAKATSDPDLTEIREDIQQS